MTVTIAIFLAVGASFGSSSQPCTGLPSLFQLTLRTTTCAVSPALAWVISCHWPIGPAAISDGVVKLVCTIAARPVEQLTEAGSSVPPKDSCAAASSCAVPPGVGGRLTMRRSPAASSDASRDLPSQLQARAVTVAGNFGVILTA